MSATTRARRRLSVTLAAAACAVASAGCGSSGPKPRAASHASSLLAFAECMRSHGVTGFPDPGTTPPTNPSNYSIIEGIGDEFLLVPNTIHVSSPAFKRAAMACNF